MAVLVVAAGVGEYEAGMSREGQTREHMVLCYALGVKHLVVAVNKMDRQDWKKERFDDIVKETTNFLKKTGFKPENVQFIPYSGL